MRENGQRLSAGFKAPLPRPTIRLRLTLIYASLFLGTGACLIAFLDLAVVHVIGVPAATFTIVQHGVRITGGLSVLKTLEEQQAAGEKRELLIVSGIALSVMAVASGMLGWLMAGRVLRPLRTITTTAQGISDRNLDQRLALDGPDDELKELGDTFDGLLGRLQRSFEAQRRFIADVSHELRTPLARQRVLGQVALADPGATVGSLRTAHERVLASGAQQERLIEALLTLALSQRGFERWEPFDLAAVTGEMLLARQPEAENQGLEVDATLNPVLALGSASLTERLVANLIDNAILHNVPGGRITVTTHAAEGSAILTVANSGRQVPPDQVSRLFQPFQRLEPGRDGHGRDNGLGLGLSIVEAIAAAHNAVLTAKPRPGGGLVVRVRFPAAFAGDERQANAGQLGQAVRG